MYNIHLNMHYVDWVCDSSFTNFNLWVACIYLISFIFRSVHFCYTWSFLLCAWLGIISPFRTMIWSTYVFSWNLQLKQDIFTSCIKQWNCSSTTKKIISYISWYYCTIISSIKWNHLQKLTVTMKNWSIKLQTK